MRKTKEILLSIVVVLICFAAIGFSERNPVKAESAEWEILYPDINVYEAQSLIKDRNGNIWNSIIENTGYGVFHKLYKNGTLMSNFQLGIYDWIVDIDEDADGFIWAAVRYGWGETYMPTRVAKINP